MREGASRPPEQREPSRRQAQGAVSHLHAHSHVRADDRFGEGYSLAYGARFLKRIVDERVKLPISARWRDSGHFHVRVENGQVVVDVGSAEPVAA